YEAAECARRLLEATAALSAATTVPAVCEAAVEHVVGALGARAGGVWLLDEARPSEPELAAARGFSSAVGRFTRMRLDGGPRLPITEAIASGAPSFLSRTELLDGYPALADVDALGSPTAGVICIPLEVEQRRIG